MRFMDEQPPARMDEGVFMDDSSGPQPTGHKMSKAVVGMKGLAHADVIVRANELKTGMDGNVNFTSPSPSVANYQALIVTALAKMAARKTADEAAQKATQDEMDAIAAIILASNGWGDYVQNESKGDATKIASANMGVKAAPSIVGPLARVDKLSVTTGDNPGEVDLHWNALTGRSTYEIQKCIGDPNIEANWTLVASGRPSKATLKGLVSGTKIWVRVRAKAPKEVNDGPWSQPAGIIVP
jgi:hypothetical protein